MSIERYRGSEGVGAARSEFSKDAQLQAAILGKAMQWLTRNSSRLEYPDGAQIGFIVLKGNGIRIAISESLGRSFRNAHDWGMDMPVETPGTHEIAVTYLIEDITVPRRGLSKAKKAYSAGRIAACNGEKGSTHAVYTLNERGFENWKWGRTIDHYLGGLNGNRTISTEGVLESILDGLSKPSTHVDRFATWISGRTQIVEKGAHRAKQRLQIQGI